MQTEKSLKMFSTLLVLEVGERTTILADALWLFCAISIFPPLSEVKRGDESADYERSLMKREIKIFDENGGN